MTIARIWRGLTLAAKSGQYLEYLNRAVLPACRIAEGNEGFFVLKECQGELAHFLVLTFWASDEALAKYAGHTDDVVHPTPEERDLLMAFESTARRYRVVQSHCTGDPSGSPRVSP